LYLLLIYFFPSLLFHSLLSVSLSFALNVFYFAWVPLYIEYICVCLFICDYDTVFLSYSLPLSFTFFARDKIHRAFVSVGGHKIRCDFNVAWNS
jgi:hypothetical protein